MEFNAEQLKREIVEALKAERWEDALPKLEMWCDRFPDQSRSWLNRGYCLVRLERYSEAVPALVRMLGAEAAGLAIIVAALLAGDTQMAFQVFLILGGYAAGVPGS